MAAEEALRIAETDTARVNAQTQKRDAEIALGQAVAEAQKHPNGDPIIDQQIRAALAEVQCDRPVKKILKSGGPTFG